MSRAKAAFEAWAKHTRSSWEWEYLPQNERQAWELAAEAALSFSAASETSVQLKDGRVDRCG